MKQTFLLNTILLCLSGGPLIPHMRAASPSSDNQDWPGYGGGPQGIRYSNLDQINQANVAGLQVAWTFDTQDGPGASETQPIVVNGVLFGLTPRHKVVALDAATGKQLWRFCFGGGGPGGNCGAVFLVAG